MVGTKQSETSSATIKINDDKRQAYFIYDTEEQLDGTWKVKKTSLHTGDGDDSKLAVKYGEYDQYGYYFAGEGVKVGTETKLVMEGKEGFLRLYNPVLQIYFDGMLNSELNDNGDGNYSDEWKKFMDFDKYSVTDPKWMEAHRTQNPEHWKIIKSGESDELSRFGFKYDDQDNTFIVDGAEYEPNFSVAAYNYLTLIRPVHFDANGGQGTITSVNAYTGAKVSRDIDGCKYDANGNKTTQKANEADGMTRSGYKFVSWNTKADGTGTSYRPGEFFVVPAGEASYTLYAQWERNAPTIIPDDPNPPVVIEDDDTPQDEVPDVVEPVEEEVIDDDSTPLAEDIIVDQETPLAENNSDSPKTGDSNNVPLWIALLLVSALGAGGAAYSLKRKEK